mmetsp:Transcript_10009/g.24734  ORF Transcript_10009/g.24734 Transcript_10009/m.24734 type:complete len:294 (-) Transcript_10009:1960-2841(-)
MEGSTTAKLASATRLLGVHPRALGAPQGDHLLRRRGVDAHDQVPLVEVEPRDEGRREALRHLAGVGAQVVEANDALVIKVVDDDLGVARRDLVGQRVLEGRELAVVHLDRLIAERLNRTLLREPDRPVLERREHRRGHVVQVDHVVRVAVDALGQHQALLNGHRRELGDAVRHVAQGVHAGRRRALVPRPDLAVVGHLDARGLEVELLGDGLAANGEHDGLERLHRLDAGVDVLERYLALPVARRLDAHRDALLDESGAGVDHVLLDAVRAVAVEAAENHAPHHDRDIEAEAR